MNDSIEGDVPWIYYSTTILGGCPISEIEQFSNIIASFVNEYIARMSYNIGSKRNRQGTEDSLEGFRKDRFYKLV